MSNQTDQGGMAFPSPDGECNQNGQWVSPENPGMTFRDYLAAKAMPVLIQIRQQHLGDAFNDWSPIDVRNVCEGSFEWADAMIAARNKKPTP